MRVRYIGVITGGLASQRQFNTVHAQEIGAILSSTYQVSYYDLASEAGIDQLIRDRRAKKLDLVFNNTAGKKGGDGTVEGFLAILGIPYVGSDALATAVAFDKRMTKAIVAEAGVPVIKGVSIFLQEYKQNPSGVVQNITSSLGYPVVVKASQGSDSIGISLVKHPRRLIPALKRAFKEDDQVIVEEFIQRQAEVTCLVLGNGSGAYALHPIERVYDTELLYALDVTKRTYQVPNLDPAVIEDIKNYACIAHQALGCADYSRSDFLIDKNNAVHFLETNGHAGLGALGTHVQAAKITRNWEYEHLVHEIVNMAIVRHK